MNLGCPAEDRKAFEYNLAHRIYLLAAVAAYKSLAHVERAFRSMKTVDLNVRPFLRCSEQRVRAQVLLCMSCCACWPTASNGTCALA